MSSITSTAFDEKDSEQGQFVENKVSSPSFLPIVVEESDADEALKVVGYVRNEITAEEDEAVKRKLDRLLLPLLASVYFSQFLVSSKAQVGEGIEADMIWIG
jgi:ACS family allantoate permease-like MFS transporter